MAITMGQLKNADPNLCYACDRRATTREHVPPLCLFPQEYRSNLVTVPSCSAHNNANSKDVEYARNVLVCASKELGPESAAVFARMMRSMERRPAIVDTTFPDLHPIEFGGEQTGYFSIDLHRFNRIMVAIAQALHYRDLGSKVRYWEVFCPTLHSAASLARRPDEFEPIRRNLVLLKFG